MDITIKLMKCVGRLMKYLYCKTFFYFDMVSDKVKLRGIIPFSIVFILFILVSSIFTTFFSEISVPTNLKLVVSPQKYLQVGETARSFMIQVTDQNSFPISNLSIFIFVLNFILKMKNDYINCDYTYLSQNFWNYFFIRNLGPCEINFEGQNQVTDSNGFAYFTHFYFESAPQGSYYLAFRVNNTEVVSSSFNMILAPSALMIKMLNSPPKSAIVNSPLEIQPNLIVYDKFGLPLDNVTINAVSWPFGDSNTSYPQLFDPDWDKFALIGGSKSMPSNKEGYANFTNLTILGSSHENVYIIFIPEGNQIIIPWAPAMFPNDFVGTYKFQLFIPPIKILYSNTHDINIIQSLGTQALEGSQISPFPTLKLIDKNSGTALPGFLCFVLLRSFANLNFSLGYQPIMYRQYQKSILRGITGNYSECDTISSACFSPIFTDSEGNVEYSGLAVSQGGSNYEVSQKFGVLFLCGNAQTKIQFSNLSTSIYDIKFLNLPSFLDTTFVNYYQLTYNDSYSIQISDINNNPITNKIVNTMVLVDKDNLIQSDILLRNDYDIVAFIWSYSLNSDEFGIINGVLLIYKNTYGKFGQFYLKITIDGISSISQSLLNITMRTDGTNLCNFLEIQNNINSFNLLDDDRLSITLTPNDLKGNSQLDHELDITIFSSTEYYPLKFYEGSPIKYYYYKTKFSYTIPQSTSSIEINDMSLS